MWVALAAVLLLGVALRPRYFMGVVGSDNLEYLATAYSLTRGNDVFGANGLAHFPFHVGRLAIVLPLAVTLPVLGAAEGAAAAWTQICSLGSVLLAFLFGRRLAGATAGLAAAAVLAAHPLEGLYATTPLPDAVWTFALGLSVWLFDLALDAGGRRAWALYAGAGAAVSAAYYGRITAFVVLGVFAVWLLWRRRRPTWSLAFVGLGMLATLVLGTAFVVSRGGTWSFELTQTFGLAGATQLDVIQYGVAPLFGFAGEYLLDPRFGRWTLLVGAAALVLLVKRDRRLVGLGAWFGVWYVFLEFASQYPVLVHSVKEPR